MFDQDPETKAVVLFCEPGGIVEETLADFVAEGKAKIPIIAFIGVLIS